MDVFEAIERRASVRTFTGEPLTEEEITKLARAALRAPTAGNLLHYSVVCITGDHQKEALYDLCSKQPFIKSAALLMVFNIDENRNKKWIDRWGGHFHFDGPYPASIASSDALIAAQNVVLAAEAMGLGSVYVGNVIGAAQKVREALGYPDLVVPLAMLCIGRPRAVPEPRGRLDLRAVLHRERYQDFSSDEIEGLYGDLERQWADANPEGMLSRTGVKVTSRAQWTTLAHYTEQSIREGDLQMRLALEDAGFHGFAK